MSDELSYAEAVAAVEAARAALETDMIAAKEAYRADPTPENKAAKEAAVAELQNARAIERAGRDGTRPGGDAFVSSEEN